MNIKGCNHDDLLAIKLQKLLLFLPQDGTHGYCVWFCVTFHEYFYLFFKTSHEKKSEATEF